MSKARMIGIAPQLVVNDVRKTVAYYLDRLGFSLISLVGDPPVYGMVIRDGCQVHFIQSDKETVPLNREYRSISYDFIIWVPEIDLFYEELKARKVSLSEAIVLREYGNREFTIEDCDGRRILVCD